MTAVLRSEQDAASPHHSHYAHSWTQTSHEDKAHHGTAHSHHSAHKEPPSEPNPHEPVARKSKWASRDVLDRQIGELHAADAQMNDLVAKHFEEFKQTEKNEYLTYIDRYRDRGDIKDTYRKEYDAKEERTDIFESDFRDGSRKLEQRIKALREGKHKLKEGESIAKDIEKQREKYQKLYDLLVKKKYHAGPVLSKSKPKPTKVAKEPRAKKPHIIDISTSTHSVKDEAPTRPDYIRSHEESQTGVACPTA